MLILSTWSLLAGVFEFEVLMLSSMQESYVINDTSFAEWLCCIREAKLLRSCEAERQSSVCIDLRSNCMEWSMKSMTWAGATPVPRQATQHLLNIKLDSCRTFHTQYIQLVNTELYQTQGQTP
jgi:hypothetical protein